MIAYFIPVVIACALLASAVNHIERVGWRCGLGRHEKRGTYQRMTMDNGSLSPAGITRGLACIRCEWIDADDHVTFWVRTGPIWYYEAGKRVFLPWSLKLWPSEETP